jgi:hypothetical protein
MLQQSLAEAIYYSCEKWLLPKPSCKNMAAIQVASNQCLKFLTHHYLAPRDKSMNDVNASWEIELTGCQQPICLEMQKAH